MYIYWGKKFGELVSPILYNYIYKFFLAETEMDTQNKKSDSAKAQPQVKNPPSSGMSHSSYQKRLAQKVFEAFDDDYSDDDCYV